MRVSASRWEPQRHREPDGDTVPLVSKSVSKAEYLWLTARAQVHRIRQVALGALGAYDLPVRSMRLVAHDYNTTFRVDTEDGRRFALRVNVNSVKGQAELDAELAWLDALRRETDLPVPAPHPTADGALRTSGWCEILGRELPVVAMTWLPGRNLGTGDVASVHALGGAMALLHEHAVDWSLPTGTSLPSHSDVLVDMPNRLADHHPGLDDAGRSVLADVHRVAQCVYDEVIVEGPVHALHADLHGDNAKWCRRQVAVFDFDDAAIGAPAQDIGVAVYYLRSRPELEAAFLGGYDSVRPLPALPPERYESLIAARNLALINDVMGGAGSADRDFAEVYARNTVTKLRAFLETGEYRHDVPGLLPISF